MPRNILTNRRIFWSLAFVATVLFLSHGDAGSGARSLKNFWESRERAVTAEMSRSASGLAFRGILQI